MQKEIKITADGSATLFVPGLNEHYHSTYGAVQESMHVFINAGFRYLDFDHLRILEFGFGTGLNALLTLVESKGTKIVDYHSLELFPLSWEQVRLMKYPEYLKLDREYVRLFRAMHESEWNVWKELTPSFFFKREKIHFKEFSSAEKYDLVYFDAFAPNVQPELWDEDIFRKLYGWLNPNALVTTYCAKGEIRRRMQRAGFSVERLPGPPGKMEMLRARKIVNS